VLTEQSILVRGGRIVSVTPGYSTPSNGAKVVDLKSSFVLPGLIDSHVHITGEQGPDSRVDEFITTSADQAIDGAGYALKTLNAGFTTIADLGADADAILALRRGIATGIIPGPRIIASARRDQRAWWPWRRQRHAARSCPAVPRQRRLLGRR
jgi:imidazolonepropionase-like amidohydrolase